MLDLEYNDIFKEDRGALNTGRLKITGQAIIFKNNKTGKVEQLSGNDVENVNWQRMANGYGLRIMARNGNLLRYGGFVESDLDKLTKFFDNNFSITIQPKDFCLKGWNWGQANFHGSVLSFDVDKNNTAFEVPLSNVSHCTTAKNEVTLEFHQNDDAAVSLMELRFHIPTQSDGIVDDPVQAFMDAVLSKASVIQATGDAIATFSELQCLTPRGRYDIKIFPSFIQLHGKTFDYKIPLTTILRLFRLPHKDNRQVFFVVSLDPPIKQGQTRYHFLILLFNKEDVTNIELTVSDREFQEKYEGKLEKQISGQTADVLGQIMKVVVQRKITVPAPLAGGGGNCAISCSYRAGAGLLYPLERGFIYVHKPPCHIRFDEILSVNFARSGGSTRSFDFEVETKSMIVHTFSSIEKEEYSKLYDFVASKKLRIKNKGTEPQATEAANDDLVDSDIEDEPDAYLARVKQEGRDRAADDSDESDESFNPGEMDSGDVAEEFDSNASVSSSSDEEGEGGAGLGGGDKVRKEKQKEKKPKEKKEKKKKEKKEKEPKKKKKKRDENQPKKPMSAYFLWLNESRERLKKEYPGLVLTELSKKAGELWKELKDKTKWEKLAVEAKKQYEIDMAEFKASGGGSSAAPSSSNTTKSEKTKKSSDKKSKSPVKSSASGNFKSKEYISDESSSSEDEKSKKKMKKDASESDSDSD